MNKSMKYKEAHTKILTAQKLFMEPISLDSLMRISTLLKGINPRVDAVLNRAEQEFDTYKKIYGGEIIELGVEHLPETTEEEKRRKKALLLFLNTWKTLKSEVARVEAELSHTAQGDTSAWGRIFSFAKGPFGIVTIIAVGLVLLLQQTSINLTIRNQGCGTMMVSGSLPFALPGFSLPSEPIANGASGTAVLPPLTVEVDGTQKSALTLKALAFSAAFELPGNIKDVTLDGTSLLNTTQQVSLHTQKEHTLVLVCS